jgi:signal transduction histidine kinase
MANDQLIKIFNPYYRVEETSHFPGTGLGLFIAQEFVEYHKGSIEVESVVGEGSTFTFKLPKV